MIIISNFFASLFKTNKNIEIRYVKDTKKSFIFCSYRDGVGKSSCIINLASTLYKYTQKKICVIDFSIGTPDITYLLGGTEFKYKIDYLLHNKIEKNDLEKYVLKVSSEDLKNNIISFDLICGSNTCNMHKNITENLKNLLKIIYEEYDIVLIDTNSSLNRKIFNTLKEKTLGTFILLEQDYLSTINTKSYMNNFNIDSKNANLIINRYNKNVKGFSIEDIISTLDVNIYSVLSEYKECKEDINNKKFITLYNPIGSVAEEYFKISKIIEPI